MFGPRVGEGLAPMILNVLIFVVLVVFLLPVAVYLSVKFGRVGWLRANKFFRDREKNNGER